MISLWALNHPNGHGRTGAADYLAVAQRFHTIAVLNVPQMSSNSADAARRFITLIDEVYNHRCALLMTAAAPPDELFAGTEHGTLIDLEALQFEGEVEGRRSRRDVKVSGDVAPVASTKEAMAVRRRQLCALVHLRAPAPVAISPLCFCSALMRNH